jgi:hypothetical protein
MINVTEQQKTLLKKYIPTYSDTDDIDYLLDRLDTAMLNSLINDESTPETTPISKLYDAIYSQN